MVNATSVKNMVTWPAIALTRGVLIASFLKIVRQLHKHLSHRHYLIRQDHLIPPLPRVHVLVIGVDLPITLLTNVLYMKNA